MPAALEQLGLWHKPNAFSAEQLAGVIVLSVPMQERVIPAYFTGLNPREGAEIGRLVLLDFMPGNSETWFLGRAFRHLRRTMPQQR
ncbi:MAG TPA: hypothetical protein VJ608_04960, partial [Albitalea sp.]|nr:hypothetical protein [Albitalea sp.]